MPPAKKKTTKKRSAKKAAKRVVKKASGEKKVVKKSSAKKSPKKSSGKGGKIMVEACKSWGIFKRSAEKLFAAVNELAPGKFKLAVNEQGKAGKGNFVVNVGTKNYVSLLGMPRRFENLRALDLDKVAAKIVEG